MAIITNLTKVKQAVCGYNNNILKFHTDTKDKNIAYAILKIKPDDKTKNILEFKIYPHPQTKEFYYNLKEFIKYALGDFNNKLDYKGLFNSTGYMIKYFINSIYISIDLYFIDGSKEQMGDYHIYVTRGVRQIEHIEYDKENAEFVFPQYKKDKFKIPIYIWRGYPISIGMINGTPQNYYTYTRILSDGEKIIEDKKFLKEYNITIKDTYCEDGIYIRWLNSEGKYSYWLFDDVYTETVKSKANKKIHIPDTTISAFANFKSSGQECIKTLNLVAKGLSQKEFEYLKDIAQSPEIYKYIGNKGQASDGTQFIILSAPKITVGYKSKNRDTQNIGISLEYSKLNTQTLY